MLAGSMGGAFFEGWVIMELVKMIAAAGRRPDLYFWRSNDGIEVDIVICHKGLLWPVEIKRTATPMPRHLDMLKRFVKTVGQSRCGRPVLICCTESSVDLGDIAVRSWQNFLMEWKSDKED
jgi:predicted AAA+ superfamily ATPase